MKTRPDTEAIRTDRLELIALTPAFVQALVAGEVAGAGAVIGARVGRSLANDPSHIIQLHLAQRAGEAAGYAGLGRVIVLRSGAGGRRAIGSIGCHGPPDERGRLEVACRIQPGSRGQGYGAEALNALLEYAATTFGVTRFLIAVPSQPESGTLVAVEMAFEERPASDRSAAGQANLIHLEW